MDDDLDSGREPVGEAMLRVAIEGNIKAMNAAATKIIVLEAKLAHWKKENDEAMNSIDELEQKLEKAEANAAQLLLIVKDMRTLVASGRLCSIGSEDNTYEVQVRSNVIQEWNNVINSSTAGAALMEKMERYEKALKSIEAWDYGVVPGGTDDREKLNYWAGEIRMARMNALKALDEKDGEGDE